MTLSWPNQGDANTVHLSFSGPLIMLANDCIQVKQLRQSFQSSQVEGTLTRETFFSGACHNSILTTTCIPLNVLGIKHWPIFQVSKRLLLGLQIHILWEKNCCGIMGWEQGQKVKFPRKVPLVWEPLNFDTSCWLSDVRQMLVKIRQELISSSTSRSFTRARTRAHIPWSCRLPLGPFEGSEEKKGLQGKKNTRLGIHLHLGN